MQGKNTQKSGMLEIRDLLKGEFSKFSQISSSLNQQKDDFEKIKDTLTTYGGEIDHSSIYINQLKRREFFENLFIYFGLAFYILCIIYVLLKRFPLHRIIFLCWNIVTYMVSGIVISYGYIIDSLNSVQHNHSILNETVKIIANITSQSLNHSEF